MKSRRQIACLYDLPLLKVSQRSGHLEYFGISPGAYAKAVIRSLHELCAGRVHRAKFFYLFICHDCVDTASFTLDFSYSQYIFFHHIRRKPSLSFQIFMGYSVDFYAHIYSVGKRS